MAYRRPWAKYPISDAEYIGTAVFFIILIILVSWFSYWLSRVPSDESLERYRAKQKAREELELV